jgi:hypothetical protein
MSYSLGSGVVRKSLLHSYCNSFLARP